MTATCITLRDLAERIGATVEGDDAVTVGAMASLETAGPGELTFAKDARRAAALADGGASAAIVPAEADVSVGPVALLRVANVDQAVARALACFAGAPDVPPPGVHPSAVVDPAARLGEGAAVGPLASVAAGATIGPGAVLCAGVRIGRNAVVGPACVLRENVVVQAECVLGARVRVGPGSVIGYDGFGYYYADGAHHHVPHTGNVVIEDDVDLGACACVDRAKFGSTRIGAGSKIDNLVQVAHNVQIGPGCLLAAQVGIAGSTRLGAFVVLGGHTGVRDNITLGDGVRCAAYAAIAQDVPAGRTMAGIPAEEAGLMLRVYRATTRLPDLVKRVRALESRLQALESAEDD